MTDKILNREVLDCTVDRVCRVTESGGARVPTKAIASDIQGDRFACDRHLGNHLWDADNGYIQSSS